MKQGTIMISALVLGLALVTAWSTAAGQEKQADPLSGKRFRSVEKHEVGLGPDGKPALGYWHLAFRGGGFTWHHSDVTESGAYQYDEKTAMLTGAPRSGKLTYEGTYDPKTGILTWEKKKYQETRPEKP